MYPIASKPVTLLVEGHRSTSGKEILDICIRRYAFEIVMILNAKAHIVMVTVKQFQNFECNILFYYVQILQRNENSQMTLE